VTYERIDPEHPLTRAARPNNAYAETVGSEAVMEGIGMLDEATLSQLMYLAEQRAYRVIAAFQGKVNPEGPVELSVGQRQIVDLFLIPAYLDGMAIGWLGHEFAHTDD
jgi:hypothetical protein